MALHLVKLGVATLALTALGLFAIPTGALAQDTPEDTTATGISNKKVTVTVESADLYYTLKLLFAQIKADFTLDTSLRGIQVTASLKNQPFRIALETILKSAPMPLTYRFENNIYSIVPKIDTGADLVDNGKDNTEPDVPTRFLPQKIFKGSALTFNAINIVELLGGRVIRAWGSMSNSGGFGQGGFGGSFGGGLGSFGGGGNGLGQGSNIGGGTLGGSNRGGNFGSGSFGNGGSGR